MRYNISIFLLFTLFAVMLLAPELASAGGVIADTLCNAVAFITSGVGAAIATMAIIIIGVGALMGKVSWGMAIIVALGIAIIFGAGDIARALNAPGAEACGLAGGTGGGEAF